MKTLNLRRVLVSLACAICAIAGAATMQARADIVVSGDTFIGVVVPPDGVIAADGVDVLDVTGITLGSNGIGSLLIDGNNTLTTDDGTLAQGLFDTFGTATLTGPFAIWNMKILGPGSDGTGVLNIWNGATVNVTGGVLEFCDPCGEVIIAGAVTSNGMVSVQGSGSSLNVAASIDIGGEGRGFLTIVDGGVVNAGAGFPVNHEVAGGAGSSGTAIVQGSGSQLNLTGRLTVGNSSNATGTVNISDGGALTATSLRLGNSAGASGTVNITNGGTLTRTGGAGSFTSRIGNQGSGVVTVSGLGSMLTFQGLRDNGNPDRVRIGDSGFGALHVSGGGQVLVDGTEVAAPPVTDPPTNAPTTGFRLGRDINSVGVMTVKGLGSLVTVDGGLNARVRVNIGQRIEAADPSETGTMVIADGGRVDILGNNPDSAVIVANRPGAVGTIRVTGSAIDESMVEFPSTLNAGKLLCVGLRPSIDPADFNCGVQEAGIGTLIIDDGGVVNVETFGIGTLGRLFGDGGTINVSGATLTNGGTIQPGGTMTINGRFVQTPGGTIILTVNGTGEGEFDQLVLTGEVTLEGTIEVIVAEGVVLTGETSLEVLVVDQALVDDTVSAEVNVMDESGGLIASFQSTDSGGLNIQFTSVAIDIKPGSDTNSINLGSNGVVPVAILSSATFDATTVDPTSVKLASAAIKVRGNGTFMNSIEDVNGDGLADLVIQVETTALGLTSTATEATLTGSTFDNVVIQGMDLILVVPEET